MTAGTRGARRLLAALGVALTAALGLVWWALARAEPREFASAGVVTTTGAAGSHSDLAAPAGVAGKPARVGALAAGADAPPQHATEPHAITVQVIDEREQPLPGALVRLLDQDRSGQWTTDAEGRVRLPVTIEVATDARGALASIGHSQERLLLSAEKPGYLHVQRAPRLAGTVFLQLHRLIPVRGRVLDAASRAAVTGATVTFRHRDCDTCIPEAALTDASGSYRLAGVPAGARTELAVEAEGFVATHSRFEADPNATGAEHEVVLERGVAVQLTVVAAETGAPIEGAEVRGASGPFGTDALGQLESDQLVELGERRGKLVITAPERCRLILQPAPRELAERPELVVPLVRSVAVEGRVVDAGGRPASPPIELAWSGELELVETTAPQALTTRMSELPRWRLGPPREGPDLELGPGGAFVLTGLPPHLDGLTLTATAADGARGSATLTLPGPGQTAGVAITVATAGLVEGPATIRGRLTLGGEPEQGRVVWRGATLSGHGRSGEDGGFVLEGVEPGPVTLTAQSDRVLARSTCALGQLAPLELFVRAGEELEQDLALELALAPVAGRVTEADGRPASGVEVEVRDPGRCWRERVPTDDEGRFELAVPAELPAYRVRVTRAPEELRRDDVAPGSAGVDFVLSALGRLRFRVTDADDGSAVPRGVIEWRRPGGRHEELVDFGRLVPDPGGWYEVPCVAGELDLTASTARDRHVPRMLRRVSVPAGGTAEVEFELRPGLTRRLVLEEGSIEPPEGFAAVLLPESVADRVDYTLDPRPHWAGLGRRGPFDELRFKAGGVARARGLKPGPYRILVWPPSVRMAPERLRLKASEPEATVHLRLAWR